MRRLSGSAGRRIEQEDAMVAILRIILIAATVEEME